MSRQTLSSESALKAPDYCVRNERALIGQPELREDGKVHPGRKNVLGDIHWPLPAQKPYVTLSKFCLLILQNDLSPRMCKGSLPEKQKPQHWAGCSLLLSACWFLVMSLLLKLVLPFWYPRNTRLWMSVMKWGVLVFLENSRGDLVGWHEGQIGLCLGAGCLRMLMWWCAAGAWNWEPALPAVETEHGIVTIWQGRKMG